MSKYNLNKKLDYKFSQYYNNCDFINKYNLKSFYNKPTIKQIVLELPLDEIINSFVVKSQYTNESVQIIGILFFYIMSNLLPFINFSKSKTLKITNKSNYSLKIVYNKEQQIYSFLHDIYEKLKIENLKNFKKNKNYFLLTEICKAEVFFELETLIDKYIKIINIKELNFYLRFSFFNPLELNSSKNFVQNFLFLDK